MKLVYRVLREGEERLAKAPAINSNSYYLEDLWIGGARWAEEDNSIDENSNPRETCHELPPIQMTVVQTNGQPIEPKEFFVLNTEISSPKEALRKTAKLLPAAMKLKLEQEMLSRS
jgi:hypothetical protein